MDSYEEIESKINKYLQSNIKLSVNQVKKNNLSHYVVADGYFRYKISLIPKISCQCDKTICNHVLSVLFNQLHLSKFCVMYLFIAPPILSFFEKNIQQRNLNTLLEKEIDTFLSSDFCGICFNKLNDNKYQYNLGQCVICKKFTHNYCLSLWKKKSQLCIYCGL